jgi:hypothetical protein
MAAGRNVDQEAAVAELREISTDREALAEAAAFYASDDDCHYRAQAVALLIQAGADSASLARYVRGAVAPDARRVQHGQARRRDEPVGVDAAASARLGGSARAGR